jgi:hypothetical protein
VRTSEFWQLVTDEFGQAHGFTLVRDHVVGRLGHRTAQQALDGGEEPRAVWLALCEELDVPEARRWGTDVSAGPAGRRSGSGGGGRSVRGVSRTSNTRSV